MLAGMHQPECFVVSGEQYQSEFYGFYDMFALSWTTFTTVVRKHTRHKSLRAV